MQRIHGRVRRTKFKVGGKRFAQRQGLSELLKNLGLQQRYCANKGKRSLAIVSRKPTDTELWDLYEEAEAKYKELILKHHPDRGGTLEEAAVVNELWLNIKKTFRKKYRIVRD